MKRFTHDYLTPLVGCSTLLLGSPTPWVRGIAMPGRIRRALVKAGGLEPHGPVRAPRAVPVTDEQYAKALANVKQRMKGIL